MSPLVQTFPCLGLKLLGMCAYNPAQPSPTYFTIGDAIAALGFTLAIQQLFKPIYLFRLRAYGLRILHLSGAVFLGAVCSIVAMILPNISINNRGMLAYPILWELFGGILIFGAYGIAAWVTLRPARINSFNLVPFIRAAGILLSEASDDDRANFARDLLTGKNLKRLFGYASAWMVAEFQASTIEFEKLRETSQPSAPLTIGGRPTISAFYLFAHRRELSAAQAAATLLHIMSDPEFCSVLVRKCSWLTAATLDSLAKDNLHVRQANAFVQEIASQAILEDDSMLGKEVGYTGFGTIPYLLQSLFGNWFILNSYDPLDRLTFKTPKAPSEQFVARLNGATKLMFETAIKGESYWGQQYIYSAQQVYEDLTRHWGYLRPNPMPVDYTVTLHLGVLQLCKMMRHALGQLKPERRKSLFVRDTKTFKNDIVDSLASIIYGSLTCISNDFKGGDDSAWIHAIDVFMDIYPEFETEPAGMDPLQQHLALKLIDKLRNNMDGRYPAISRVLLATIGPYTIKHQTVARTAHVLLKDAVYRELQKLPALHAKSPEKVPDFLPPNITYDAATDSLTHIYRGGETQVTELSTLQIPEINLCDEGTWTTVEGTDPDEFSVFFDPE